MFLKLFCVLAMNFLGFFSGCLAISSEFSGNLLRLTYNFPEFLVARIQKSPEAVKPLGIQFANVSIFISILNTIPKRVDFYLNFKHNARN